MTEIIRKQIKSISFSLVNPEEIKKVAVAKIVTPELYDMDGYPVDGGLMDLRLGAIDPGVRCRTCGGRLKECLGHFGYIEMARPVIHIKYISFIHNVLKSICNNCSRILLSDEEIKKLSLPERQKKSKDAKKCPYCNSVQEKIKIEKPTNFVIGKKRLFPSELRSRLEKVSNEDLQTIGINPETARPEWAILTLLLVPPVTVRPSITLESSERSEDDLTHKLGDIIRANQRLWENLNAGAPEVIVEDLWDLLQYHITTFFDNSVAGVPPARHRSGQPLKTITERIKGKEGRIRHNLAGKRVNYSSRTVISPDPFMEIDEIGVPLEIAKVITVAERVNSLNLEKMKKIVLSQEYPAANYILRPDGKRKRITPDLQQELAEELSIGYIVERHLIDKDILLFNRHPSLHKMSLMSHYTKILPGRTFRLHPSVTFPYNADFDGDEMNIHSPQTEEARAEAEVLLEIKRQLISPKNNTNMIGCIADAITGNYLLSCSQISKEDAAQLLYESGVNEKDIKFHGKIEGKDVFSAIFHKIDFSERTKLCQASECPHYNKRADGENCFADCKKEKCPFNAYLSIKDGKLESGIIDSRTFGVEEGVLVKEFDQKVGRDETMSLLKKIFSMGSLYLSRRGFTISLDDIKVPSHVNEMTQKIIGSAEDKVLGIIKSYNESTLELLPGKTREETMEIRILHSLNEVRSKIGEIVKRDLPKTNPVYTMILSGAGGNVIYITQMACSVGQQAFWGKRISLGFVNRTLSFFKKHDLSPKARGFIYSSFLDGVKPYEFFFGAMTGRDGLMDTALRTPKSGYLYRRLVNALQDLKVEYDSTIRDASGNVVQFEYGGDNCDVSKLHLKNKKIDPAEAVGVITAQSFGEPSVQMTLNVFHFAGVSEMQVTLGLPRLIEIFDARKKPSTPLMEIHLEKEFNNDESAKDIAARIKQVKLSEIADKIGINFTDKRINISLNKDSMKRLHVTPHNIIEKIEEKGFNVKISENNLVVKSKEDFKGLYKAKEKIKEILISGVEGIEQVLPVKRNDEYVILTSGTNLEDVMKFKGVDSNKTTSNNIHEVEKVLGIEAAREAIIKEIMQVLDQQGLDINIRHVKLVADAMTSSGVIKGITRIGIISEKTSVLARASFETPVKHFVNATLKGQKDELASVIENVILNQPVPLGTGLPGLLVNITGKLNKNKLLEKVNKKED